MSSRRSFLRPVAPCSSPSPPLPLEPPGASSCSTPLPEATDATAINFMSYRRGPGARRRVMLVTGRFGLKSYSLRDPAHPVLLDEVTAEQLRLPGDPPVDFTLDATPPSTFWQNEDMDVDRKRKLALLSRDPRAYAGSTSREPGEPDPNNATNIAGVYIGQREEPAQPELSVVPAASDRSHDHLRQRLPLALDRRPRLDHDAAATSSAGRSGGRSSSTDLSNPRNPQAYPTQPLDLFRRDGVTAYSHDVQVDDTGIAWVSGDGGTRGYWTSGTHFDPVAGATRDATPLDPIPYGGGGLPQSVTADTPAASSTTPGGRSATALPRATRATRRRAAARDRGGLRACRSVLPEPGPVLDRLARGQLRRRRLALDDGEPVPPRGGRQVEPVPEGGLTPARRVHTARELLLRPLLRRGRQHGDLRVVRRGHALPRHLGPGQPDPVRLLASGRRHRLGLVHVPRSHLHRGPHARGRRAAPDRHGGRRAGEQPRGRGA